MAGGHDILDDWHGAVGHGLIDPVAFRVLAHWVQGQVTLLKSMQVVSLAFFCFLWKPPEKVSTF